MSVSVVIPAYNAEATIERTLASVLAQTIPVDEILVIDDGSRDRTPEIVRRFAPAVRLLPQANAGPSAARNLGVQTATSRWIAFLDADDAWHPVKIERQLAALDAHPAAILCYTGLLNQFSDGSEEPVPAAPPATLPETLRLCNPGITPSCVLVSRQAFLDIGGFSSHFKGSEDWELWFQLSRRSPFCCVNEPLTLYQVSNTGLSSNAGHMFAEATRLLDQRLLDGLHGPARLLWRRRILSYQTYKAALTARASAQHNAELRYILRSFVLWPSPGFFPHRLKVLAITLRNTLRPKPAQDRP